MPRSKPKRDLEADAFSPPPTIDTPPKGNPTRGVSSIDDITANPQEKLAYWMRQNMTWGEKRLWDLLGKEGGVWGFEPQAVIGPYTLDFLSRKLLLCLEFDGPDHLKTAEKDAERDEYLYREHKIWTVRLTPAELKRLRGQKFYDFMEATIAAIIKRDPEEPAQDSPKRLSSGKKKGKKNESLAVVPKGA